MSPATPSEPSGRERREFYRITVLLPMCLQIAGDETEGELSETSVNLSAGGIGMMVTTRYKDGDILSLTLLFPEHVLFTASIEVLWLDPLPLLGGVYRLHARFVRLTTQDRELLVRYILRFQRDHLQDHYSA
ncbi:MAG TPA: PilZ domain-containing protein [Nitrospira sp.]|nr:PilZ domain-containing protein [Nitrospira sp.]HPV82107.1 PilZ domain-containing protein [Nitrospira sp.]